MKAIMLNKLPYSIKINNKKYFINTNFRDMISFEMEIQMQDIEDKVKRERFILKTLKKWCPAFFKFKYTEEEYHKLIENFLYFYKCGRENYHKSSGSGVSESQIFSYLYDDEYIFSAFYSQYRLDLTEIDHLHWWKYKSLLKGIKNDEIIEKIKSYRAYKGKDKDMIVLKEYWSLPLDKKLQKELDETAEKLMKYKK